MECIFSKFVGYTKFEVAAAIQSDLDKLEKWTDRSFKSSSEANPKSCCCGQTTLHNCAVWD